MVAELQIMNILCKTLKREREERTGKEKTRKF